MIIFHSQDLLSRDALSIMFLPSRRYHHILWSTDGLTVLARIEIVAILVHNESSLWNDYCLDYRSVQTDPARIHYIGWETFFIVDRPGVNVLAYWYFLSICNSSVLCTYSIFEAMGKFCFSNLFFFNELNSLP